MKLRRQYIKPGNSPALIGLGKFLLPIYLRLAKQVTEFVVVENGLEQLAGLAGKRVVICPNHSSEDDAEVIFGLARLSREDFFYLTAHEIFHGHKGWNHFLLPGVGCYSVTRGTPDTQAYKTTRQLLIENKRKLVVFPEGEISHFNEVVMPLEPGVVRISYSAIHKLKSMGIEDDIMILPVAIMYNYTSNIQSRLEKALAEVEAFLSIVVPRNALPKARVYSSVLALISSLELKHELSTSMPADFSTRVFNLREKMVLNVASKLNLTRPEQISQLEFAHTVKSALCDRLFHEKPRKKERKALKVLYGEVLTAIDLIAIEKSCIFDSTRVANQDELAEVVHWLEKVLFAKNSVYGKRRILIQIGNPIALEHYAKQFNLDEDSATLQVNKRVKLDLLSMLRRLTDLRMESDRRFDPPPILA